MFDLTTIQLINNHVTNMEECGQTTRSLIRPDKVRDVSAQFTSFANHHNTTYVALLEDLYSKPISFTEGDWRWHGSYSSIELYYRSTAYERD